MRVRARVRERVGERVGYLTYTVGSEDIAQIQVSEPEPVSLKLSL